MRRRRFLVGTALLATLSGCAAGYRGRDGGADSDDELPVSKSELRAAAPRDGIPAITEPAFAPDWSNVSIEREDSTYEPRLAPDDLVVGVERGGTARAYPLALLTWHEVVNDHVAEPLLVTYCPLCRSAVVARREVAGEPTTFGVSGYLYRGNLVLYDEATGSLWSQLAARAIRGPRTGDELSLLASTLTTWDAWRESHPATRVLLPAPLSDTVVGDVSPPYGIDFYERQAETREAFDLGGPDVGALPDRMLVLGVDHGGQSRAYPYPDVKNAGVVNDVVGDLPVVVTLADGELLAYERRAGGRTLEFDDDPFRAGGSRFDPLTGRALDGPLAGSRLDRVNGATAMYWFAWKKFHPETDVYGR